MCMCFGFRKKATLVIKRLQDTDYGRYECVAEGVNNETVKKGKDIRPPSSTLPNSEKPIYGTCTCTYLSCYITIALHCVRIKTVTEKLTECIYLLFIYRQPK